MSLVQASSLDCNYRKDEISRMKASPASHRSNGCRLCGGKQFQALEVAEDSVRVLKCRDCSLVFVDPQPSRWSLPDYYDEQYYQSWLTEQRPKRVKMWERRIQHLEKFKRTGRLLDVGCGEGLFLEVAKRRGWQTAGTEISGFAAEHAAKAAECEVFHGELPDAPFTDGAFDLVTLWHVLEHVRDPLAYLTEARRILAGDGVLVVAVPNLNNILMKAVYRLFKGKPLRLYEPDEKELHLFHFSSRTVPLCLKKAGFRIVRIGPDTGSVDRRKQIVDGFAVAISKITGRSIYNALEAVAVPSKIKTHVS